MGMVGMDGNLLSSQVPGETRIQKLSKMNEFYLLTLHGRYALVPICAVTFVIP